MSEDDDIRGLFSAMVSRQPEHPETTQLAAMTGRRIRRRRRVGAALSGAGLVAV